MVNLFGIVMKLRMSIQDGSDFIQRQEELLGYIIIKGFKIKDFLLFHHPDHASYKRAARQVQPAAQRIKAGAFGFVPATPYTSVNVNPIPSRIAAVVNPIKVALIISDLAQMFNNGITRIDA